MRFRQAAATAVTATILFFATQSAQAQVFVSPGWQPAPVFVQPAPVFVQSAWQPAPVFVQPAPVFVQPPRGGLVIGGGRRGRGGFVAYRRW